jgi:hypothetical protein
MFIAASLSGAKLKHCINNTSRFLKGIERANIRPSLFLLACYWEALFC